MSNLVTLIAQMYISLMPAVFAGILNMIWCKLPVCEALRKPIDGGKNFFDGKRILGCNKTWKGFLGMILFGSITTVIWGFICSKSNYLTLNNYIYVNYQNSLSYNLLMGALFGFAYALFELPNSFLKRRLDIKPGKTISGIKKVFFIFFDQADSVFGCVLIICFVYNMSIWFYFLYVLIGAITHILLNILLYLLKLRKNMF